MKTNTLKGLAIILTASAAFTACKSLKLDKNTYTVTPNPLELVGDSVRVKIDGKVPEKTFHPKAVVSFTPTIKTASGEKQLKTITLVGTKVKDAKGTVVDWKKGGKISYTDMVLYTPDMKVATLEGKLDAKIGSKSKTFSAKLADATIVTPLLTQMDEKPIMAKDQMPKVMSFNNSSDIHFLINSSDVRSSEMNQQDIKDMIKFIEGSETKIMNGKKVVGTTKNYDIKSVSISAYASPDGIESKNADLAGNRGKAAMKTLMAQFKKMKFDAGLQEGFYKTTATPEDWEGFKELLNASNIPDKEMITRILTTYSDVETREKEMKNISKAYTELADDIFPKLRRAKISINAEKAARTDDELSKMATTSPDELNIEEMLYAANLTSDLNAKMAIYNKAASKFPNDWRAVNNIGGLYLMQNKVSDAKMQFEKADKLNPNNPVVQNNLGVIARLNGDKVAAESFYKAASGAGKEVNTNMANLQILKGDYSGAVSNYGDTKSFNAALAQLLAGNKDAALQTLDASKDANTAIGLYLKAVIAARMANTSLMIESLKSSIAKDGSMKKMAQEDMEFVKFSKEVGAL